MSKKGENIYKRKDSRWEARYIKGHAADGKILYGYCYGATYAEARQKVALAKRKPLSDDEQCAFKSVLTPYCDEWLLLNRSRVSESTYVKYTTIVENHIKRGLGAVKIKALSSVAVERFTYDLLCNQMLSPKTVKDILCVLRSILKYGSRNYPDAFPPVDIAYPKEHKKEMRVLTKEEQSEFIKFLSEDTDDCKFGALLALLTGMRIGEVCALKWKDIDINGRVIRVSHTMQRLKNLTKSEEAKTKILISDPKSESSARLIPLTGLALELCRKRHSAEPEAFVLTGCTERFIEPRTLQNKMKKYTSLCNLKGVHFHVLRHTFATRCVEVGFEIKSLSEILGHASPQITLERYVHSSLELKRENMEKLLAAGY